MSMASSLCTAAAPPIQRTGSLVLRNNDLWESMESKWMDMVPLFNSVLCAGRLQKIGGTYCFIGIMLLTNKRSVQVIYYLRI